MMHLPRAFASLVLWAALAAPVAARQDAASRPSRPDPPPPPARAAPAAPAPAPGAGRTRDQCRTACAQAYYFCLSGDSPEACPDAWSQCRLACTATAPGERGSPVR